MSPTGWVGEGGSPDRNILNLTNVLWIPTRCERNHRQLLGCVELCIANFVEFSMNQGGRVAVIDGCVPADRWSDGGLSVLLVVGEACTCKVFFNGIFTFFSGSVRLACCQRTTITVARIPKGCPRATSSEKGRMPWPT